MRTLLTKKARLKKELETIDRCLDIVSGRVDRKKGFVGYQGTILAAMQYLKFYPTREVIAAMVSTARRIEGLTYVPGTMNRELRKLVAKGYLKKVICEGVAHYVPQEIS